MSVTGWPIATLVSGRIVMRDDQLIATPSGDFVRFLDAL
jgi:dihydroorotase